MNKWLDDKGLTFVEMMVSVTIIGFLIVVLYGLLDSGMAMYQTSDAYLEQMQNMRSAMETIGRDLREATSVDFKYNQLIINLPDSKVQRYGLASENVYGPSGLTGKKLWKTAPSSPIASYLSNFEINSSDKLVIVKLTAITPKGKTLILENQFAFRN